MRQESIILSGAALRLVQLACLLLLALKIAHWSLSGVFMDEAYYWMWGQHPALSYYDHPPLNAWLLGLSSLFAGWSKLALRLPVVLSLAADIVALWLIARRIGGDWRGHFWLTLLLFLATPVFAIVTDYALPDHLLLTGLLFATYFFYRFFDDRAAGLAGATRDLLLGAVCLGLAGLAKYNAAFLGLGIGAFVLLFDRTLLRQPRLYAAALLAVVLQAPVLIWNATERFASYEFILDGRHAGLRASGEGLVTFALGVLIFISPMLLWPMGRLLATGGRTLAGIGFARTTFVISSVAILLLSVFTQTLFHWNLAAYAVVIPFVVAFARPLWLFPPLQALWGAAFAVVIFLNYTSNPLIGVRGWRDESAAWSQSWAAAATAVRDARAAHDVGFVATADYTTASLLGFALVDRDVISLAQRRDQFDYWFDPAAHAGEDAILYGDSYRPLPRSITGQFETVELIVSIPVRVEGGTVNTQSIYLARGFQPR